MRQLAQKRALARTIGKGTPDGQAQPGVLSVTCRHNRPCSMMDLKYYAP
jgi:hypothetical protein